MILFCYVFYLEVIIIITIEYVEDNSCYLGLINFKVIKFSGYMELGGV